MKKLKLTLNRSEYIALATVTQRLLVRYPVTRLRENAADFALVTLWATVGLKARNKAEVMEWSGQETASLSLLQYEALAFFSLYECGDFGDWSPTSYEAAFLSRLAGTIHQHYGLQATNLPNHATPTAIATHQNDHETPQPPGSD